LQGLGSFCFGVLASSFDPKDARLIGLAFSFKHHAGYYVPNPHENETGKSILEEFRPVFESGRVVMAGHDLKFALALLRQHGVWARAKFFDTMIAHSLIEPEVRHSTNLLSETYLGYTPTSIEKVTGEETGAQASMVTAPVGVVATYAAERADVTWQLRSALAPLLKEKGQERVFYDIEAPLIPVLADMEFEGIKLDAAALAEFDRQISRQIAEKEKVICQLAGKEFNLNSPRQLGEILFDVLKICAGPKKTKTGQYATDEQTLMALAPDHEIVRHLLEHRMLSKLKSTYVDTLPGAIWPKTGRIHTTYTQTATSTGRLNSQNPNLQNIPIRTEQGREIRKAFVPRDQNYLLLSADYSQIELRIIAALSKETAMLEALTAGIDIHTATAARVYGVSLDLVTPEMRRKAKMVNYGIAYGISAFGLAQRLAIPRKEASVIMEQYFTQFSGIREYMHGTIAFARQHGYVETITGRRRYIRDIRSSNATLRGAAERNAINAPIQGSAADMIKIAMVNIHQELTRRKLQTRMLLQVHDELVFDLFKPEQDEVMPLVEEKMKTAIVLDVPIVVEMGLGENWLEAH
jgi:DNA polymerase-1